MKSSKLKITLAAVFVVLASHACAPGTPPASGETELQTMVAATLQAVTQQAANSAAQPAGIPIAFQNVSFTIPEGLAAGAASEAIPVADESVGGPWGVSPEHIEFTLTGYALQGDGFDPVVHIYPAQAYAEVNPWAQRSLDRLRVILASPSMPLTNENLPTVPFNGAAAQQYAAQAKLLPFDGGNGVRMISQYGQFPGAITKDNSFYHYEGLTSDGKYFVAVLLPVSLPLQSTADNPFADGIPYPNDISDTDGLAQYYQGITDKLNAAGNDEFTPSLDALDELIASIAILER
jgi:hypothetical protein